MSIRLIKKFKILLLFSLALIFAVSSAGQANADTLSMNYTYEFSGGTEPVGTSPWLTATFIDVSPTTVELTLSAPNLTGTEFVNDWYFNFDPSLTLSELNFAYSSGTAGGGTVSKSLNGYMSDGDGYYDIFIDYPELSGSGRFESGETATYTITYVGVGTFDVSSFNFISYPNGGSGEYFAAAKVQGIGGIDDNSGWIAVVPEPVSSTLFIVGGATLGFRRLRRNREG
jgi:hypothetical protein